MGDLELLKMRVAGQGEQLRELRAVVERQAKTGGVRYREVMALAREPRSGEAFFLRLCAYVGLSPEEARGRSRVPEVVERRRLLGRIMSEDLGWSVGSIAALMSKSGRCVRIWLR